MTGSAGSDPAGVYEPDLLGPDPREQPLAHYTAPDHRGDLFLGAPDETARQWRALAAGLARQHGGDFAGLQAQLDRHVADLGLGFRIAGDKEERPWPLGPMPILVGAREWDAVAAGLVQRANLLEAVIADLYGPQKLVAEGAIPPAIVSGSHNFARRMVGITPPGGYFLHVCAVDLARGPNGEWRVLADRVSAAIGIGYCHENRLALARTTGGLLAEIGARAHSGFFDMLRRGMAGHCVNSNPGGGDPSMALLTPGRFNQFYAEQAHLARQLGFALVEGRDLTVSDGALYARTIEGLKRIDGVWRWITTRDLDPMHFDSRSRIGVPDIVGAATQGLAMSNWPGVGVVESRAMAAFLPRLAHRVLDTDLALPNTATWWCGGEAERVHVLADLDRLMVGSAFGQRAAGLTGTAMMSGESLSEDERDTLAAAMERRPMDYVGQEIVHLSTTPTVSQGRLEARGFTLRAFLARDGAGEWVVLDGGFGRTTHTPGMPTTSIGLGESASDVCIVDTERRPAPSVPLKTASQTVRRDPGLLPSQAADNLYWLGRYGERAQQTARIVRVLLDWSARLGEAEARTAPPADGEVPSTTDRVARLLVRLGAAANDDTHAACRAIARSALAEKELPGSAAALVKREQRIALLLRDRLQRDAWRTLHRAVPGLAGEPEGKGLAAICDRLAERGAAVAGLMDHRMARAPAWRFYDLGLRIERASIVLQAAQCLIPGRASANDLAALLDIVDAQGVYRARYLAMPYIARVYDLVLLDPAIPGGLMHQLERIERHLSALPTVRSDGMPDPPLAALRQLKAQTQSSAAHELGTLTIGEWREGLGDLGREVGARFFLEPAAPEQPTTRLLA
ncbi:circularly permuted type 2 ATP-grasp protein [Erythrobacter sp.]|jgi:uncharacterized circularly permuted ATP-grasp superfamily protein/uncharacterized alpha-E superfamily protein|uniref:circularly permuted type 2 ATP-grasp protein n=1 Tax=Erythrobacter sp. TaxID=1042 RepID=UPI002EA668FC|nr:circularly permuted type 2 ATP-grasp protein [Erythrobacter sp.]